MVGSGIRKPQVNSGIATLMLVFVAGLAGAGCGGSGLSRSGLRDAYVARIVDVGVAKPVAECVVDRLFDDMTDAELKRFNAEGSSLSPAQSERIGQLADACGA
jgi:hypothetical protein